MPRRAQGTLPRVALAACIAASVYYVGAFLYVALRRMPYPFALEWLEGGSYSQVQRLLTGQPLYARPSIEYVAMIYPPLYYYAAAVAARILGLSFLALRLVSFGAAVASMLLIYAICRTEGVRKAYALMAAGLFAATYPLSGSWFDIARVDMLSICLVLAGIWLLRLRMPAAAAAGGLAFGLACLTKQAHLITVIVIAIYLVIFDRRRALFFIGATAAVLAAAYFLLNRLYSGWFGFYVWQLALGSPEYVTFEPSLFLQTAWDFWWGGILRVLPVVVVIVLGYAFLAWRRRLNPRAPLFYLACAFGLIGTAWAVVQVGGYKNDLLPAFAVLAVLFGISLQETVGPKPALPGPSGLTLLACVAQFAVLLYPLRAQIPTAADLAAGQDLVTRIHAQVGAVYIPFHPELALMAGKQPFASWSPMFQLEGNYGGGDIRTAGRVKTEFARAIARQDFSLIVLDQDPNWVWGDPELHYRISDNSVFENPDVFWPVTGWQTRPRFWMVPSEE
jgi:hypothetical protein